MMPLSFPLHSNTKEAVTGNEESILAATNNSLPSKWASMSDTAFSITAFTHM